KDEQNLLADQVQFVWLIVSTHNFMGKNNDKPVIIPIKHPLYDSSTEICLFTKDPQREFKELVATKGVKQIKKVIGLSKLRKKYEPYEAKRKLCDSYDLFLADNRILHHISSTTDMTASQLSENIETGIPKIVDKIPRKWANIQSLHIKTSAST
ncbi:3033_t:CDS:2, partial [Acaulospora colombiana]